MKSLPRNIKIDWLRFQVKSSQSSMVRQFERILDLPFEKRIQELHDIRDTNVLAMNKLWHEVYEFQGSLIGTRYPDSGSDQPYKHFVDLNGSTLSGISLDKIVLLLKICQQEYEFIANRIDIALDFPMQSPRLSYYSWESFVANNLLFNYRSVKRISNLGRNKTGTTVYLGSRESEIYVRIYDKNIDGVDYDRLEIEFKRERAKSIMNQMCDCNFSELPKLLDNIVCGQINFKEDPSTNFFKTYKRGSVLIPASKLHLDIQRSIGFIEYNCATLAMIEEHMGSEKFDKFIRSVIAAGKLKMKPRHRTMLENAKLLGFTALGIFTIFAQTSNAIAGGLTCPAPVPLSLEMSQKFPIDIVQPTATEQAYFNNIGDGCFQINSGLEYQKICLPGMIVNALKPFIIMGLGIKFIFSD